MNNMKQENDPVLAGDVGGPYEPRDMEPIKIRDDYGCPVETAVLRREWIQMKERIAELEDQLEAIQSASTIEWQDKRITELESRVKASDDEVMLKSDRAYIAGMTTGWNCAMHPKGEKAGHEELVDLVSRHRDSIVAHKQDVA